MSSQANTTNRKIKCPHCGQETLYTTTNKFRPFCSERCRLIDLGAWASESYKIEGKNRPNEFDLEETDLEIIDSLTNVAEHEKN